MSEIQARDPLAEAALAQVGSLELDHRVMAATNAIDYTRGMVVTDLASQQRAMEALATLDTGERVVAEAAEPVKKMLDRAKRAVLDHIGALLTPIQKQKDALKKEVRRFTEQQERERLEEIQRQRAEAAAATDPQEGPPVDPIAVAAPKPRAEGAGGLVVKSRVTVVRIEDPRKVALSWALNKNIPDAIFTVNAAAVKAYLLTGKPLDGAKLEVETRESYRRTV